VAFNPAAVLDLLPGSFGGTAQPGVPKAVAHKTQGVSYAGARAAYVARSLGPHFTITEHAVLMQHGDTDRPASAVANDAGGVETNRAGLVVQVEVVGFSGVTATAAQLSTLEALMLWLEAVHGIPRTWPMGRPPQTAADGYGESNGHRDADVWLTVPGWYAHSQVPENEHWDPAWTDDEWTAISSGDEQEDDMAQVPQAEWNEVRDAVRVLIWPPGTAPEDRHTPYNLQLWTLAAVSAQQDPAAFAASVAEHLSALLPDEVTVTAADVESALRRVFAAAAEPPPT
jgi:hypothetical protein